MFNKIFLGFAVLFLMAGNILGQIQYPETKKVEQTNNYFGVNVADPYRWMEDLNDDNLKLWIDKQNELTQSYISKFPGKDKIKDRLTGIWNFERAGAPSFAGKYYLMFKNNGLQNQSVLYKSEFWNGNYEKFLDPNEFSTDGTVALSFISPSNNGKYLAVGISKSGSDWREIFIYDLETGKKLDDIVQWVKFSGTNWYGDGFFYSRYPQPKEGENLKGKNESPQIFYHKIGTPQSEDKLMYEDKENPKRSFGIFSGDDEEFLYLSIGQQGSNGNLLYYKENKEGSGFVPINEDFEFDYSIVENVGNEIFIITNENAPKNKLISFDSKSGIKSAKVLIPESENVLKYASIAGGMIVAVYQQDVTDRVKVFDLKGNFIKEIKLPAIGNTGGIEARKDRVEIFYSFSSFTYPYETYRYNLETDVQELVFRPKVDFVQDDYETKQVFYKSKDGTSVPMFIVHKKGLVLNGNNPTLLYAYGGFNISMTPNFSASRIVFLENGGIYVLANIRGGSEYGEEWHKAGMLEKKQNVFDDFISAAEYLIENKYTSPSKLAIQGGSNGGLLIGAVINQRPDLFKVALPQVGVMDMLRFQKFTIGWAWVTEYGSSENEKDFSYLYAYSPYHNIRSGLEYPAVLVTTSDHDDRVVPSHSYKYTAMLQEVYKGTNPILIRVETKAGHGSGKPIAKIIEEVTDVWSFVFYNLGMNTIY